MQIKVLLTICENKQCLNEHFHLLQVWVSSDKTAIYWTVTELHEQSFTPVIKIVTIFNPIKNIKTQNLF